jgi:hypothetical protein
MRGWDRLVSWGGQLEWSAGVVSWSGQLEWSAGVVSCSDREVGSNFVNKQGIWRSENLLYLNETLIIEEKRGQIILLRYS